MRTIGVLRVAVLLRKNPQCETEQHGTTPCPAAAPDTTGVLALVLLWPHVRSGPSRARPAAEVGLTTLALLALLSGLLAGAGRLPWRART
jgi:hypothetical protein